MQSTETFRPWQHALVLLRTTPQDLVQLVKDRWILTGCSLIRGNELHEDSHHHRGISAGLLAPLRTKALWTKAA
jgi:hypothetical protein